MSDEPKLLMDRLAKLRREVTDEPLHESGRYFNEGTFWDLTQCTHGDTGRFRNDADGKAIAILWELWRSGALVPAPAVPDDVAKVRNALRSHSYIGGLDALMDKAADALEAQAAELARLREALEGLLHHEIGHVGPYAGQRVMEARAALTQPTGDPT